MELVGETVIDTYMYRDMCRDKIRVADPICVWVGGREEGVKSTFSEPPLEVEGGRGKWDKCPRASKVLT